MPDIVHRIEVKASAQQVYSVLTSEQGLAGWWTRNVKAGTRVGDVSHFQFDDKGFNRMKIAGLQPEERVAWECVDGAPEWIGTVVTFDLSQTDGFTVVLFAHRDWRVQVEFMHYCSTKWAVYLLSLKALCETGVGRPYPDDIDIG